MRLTMFTGPYPVGERLGGVGLRLWELALTLAAEGIETVIAGPPGSAVSWSQPGLRVEVFEEDTWPQLVEDADAVLTTDLPDQRVLLHAHQLGKILVCENATPIEHLDYGQVAGATDPEGVYDDLLERYLLQTWTCDHFLVRSSVERASVLGTLAAIGRLGPSHHTRSRTLHHLLTLLPVGFTDQAAALADAAPVTAGGAELVWSGGIWDYYDTVVLAEALDRMRGAGHPARLRFLYAPPPEQDIAEARRLRAAVDRLDLHELIDYPHGALAHTARDAAVKASKVLVCLARDGAENHTCLRLRLRDALLYRLPVVIDSFGASADWVTQWGIGLAVDTRDPDAVADALTRLVFDTATYQRCLDAIDRARLAHRYQAHIGNLLAFLRTGTRAPDAGSPRQQAAVAQLLRRRPSLIAAPSNPI
ncbi:hypothetical protein C1I93_05905 [Micromonospora endophytica]|uniref:Uncharacterized protein n=2 Tax=Micromonospora endophytica TaxID=515350 RepID=A0A2W2CLJ4_9ACTN|nr:glycosyltransferase [Micromonospora endophytica]PZF99392.1 hypothetical protein C1I93_05905 [Micromonospora endophytica]RIW42899.1 glycosyltransferase family 1 protein [Micromonospora endophytica]BCJ61582.1 hypothetical protein Jiend_50040 [Micromonospora endophytica]